MNRVRPTSLRKLTLPRLAASPLLAILLAVSLTLSEYQKNITLVYPKALVIPLGVAVLVGWFSYLVFTKLFHSPVAVNLAALTAVSVFFDYEPRIAVLGPVVKAISPVSNDAVVFFISVVISLSVCAGVGWLGKIVIDRLKIVEERVLDFMVIVVVIIFCFEAMGSAWSLVRLVPQMGPLPSPVTLKGPDSPTTKPDIYYLVFEDYPNSQTLKDIYGHDNHPFLDGLESRGFHVRNDAFSNYPFTQNSVPSTLQMNYLANISARYKSSEPASDFPLRSIFNNPPVVQALKQHGYTYHHLGSWWENTRNIPAADINYTEPFKLYAFGLQKTLSEFESGLLAKSVAGRMLTSGLKWGETPILLMKSSTPRSQAEYQIESIKGLSQAKIQGGRFIFGHIMLPHPPFIFNADGSTPAYSQELNDSGATIETKYLNQINYVNTQIEALVDSIKQHAQQPPVIVIQSDEGPHPREMGGSEAEEQGFDLAKLPAKKLAQKYGILAAYQLPGASDEELKQISSPVNVFRVVLNHYFGYQLSILPDCSFASADNKHPYKYTDVTGLLRPKPDLRCGQFR